MTVLASFRDISKVIIDDGGKYSIIPRATVFQYCWTKRSFDENDLFMLFEMKGDKDVSYKLYRQNISEYSRMLCFNRYFK